MKRFLLVRIVGQYIILIAVVVFLIWLLTIEIVDQNKECSIIGIEKLNSSKRNLSIDSRLKLNHFTILGTHNSYHKENFISKYQHENLDQQFYSKIRQIELDIHLMKNNHLIYHLQLFDDKTNCYCFNECLMKISKWSEKNNNHYPIYLFIEIKQMFYEDLLTGLTGGVKCKHFKEIQDQIFEIFSLENFILPGEIQGNQTSIKVALKKQRDEEVQGDYSYKNFGWPPVSKSLGKLIPVFIDDVQNLVVDLYSQCDSLKNFFFIAQSNLNLPYSSIISISNSIKDEQLLSKSLINGQLIRLLLGYGNNHLYETYQTAKKYGIHIISTDSVKCNDTLLCQTLKNQFRDSTVLCNNSTAPIFCNSSINFL